MATNYERGRSKEYRLKKKYEKDEKEGVIVLRTAGSHGFADLILINKKKKIIKFIQSKPKKFSKKQKEKLLEGFDWLTDEFQCEFIVE